MIGPVIETQRLKLMPFSEDFLTERYVGWLSDPEVVAYSEQRHRSHSIDSCREFSARFDHGPNCLWAITEKSDGRHLGNINTDVDAENQVADVAILIGEKECWGKGFGAEAWQGVMDYLLGDGDMRKVTAGTMATNNGMLAIMRKTGMVEEGRRAGQFIVDGQPVDMIMAARFADG